MLHCVTYNAARYIDISIYHDIIFSRHNTIDVCISCIDIHKSIIIGGVPAARAATTKLLSL